MRKPRSHTASKYYKKRKRAMIDRSKEYDYRWSQFSKKYREKNPFCVECLRHGIHNDKHIQVDHIIPLEINPSRKYDVDNLRSLCRRHHSMATNNFLRTGDNSIKKADSC